MLSYNWKSQDIVKKVYDILKDEIRVWMDIKGDMKDDMYDSMAEGVQNAEVVCCFMTPEYQKSPNCGLELKSAQRHGKRIIPCMVTDKKVWKPTGWLDLITGHIISIDFHDTSDENFSLQMKELIRRIKEQSPAPISPVSQIVSKPSYLFELIRHEYERNSRIERIMNPSKSFPIERSYINLAIVETKEQQEKEKKLGDTKRSDKIISTFEEIYGTKSVIQVKDIFEKCKDETSKLLVFGRAGIGKSTFCRFVAHQWAIGAIWTQYDLIVLIPLRRLTEKDRYPPLLPGTNYLPIDLIKKEYLPNLKKNDEKLLEEQLSKSKVLWLLDGYDEIAQNMPKSLKSLLFEQLLKTAHHILTSRPYLNTLSYDVNMEITGFTDDNIAEYVKQFFDQSKDKLKDALFKGQKLQSFLKSSPTIWGIAHIPVNLELICSLWDETPLPGTKELTVTALYDNITEWLCRRYLINQNSDIQMTKEDLYTDFRKELTFLETLAFKAMQNNTIILGKELLQKVFKETEYSSKHYALILKIGILKSIGDQSNGNQIEVQKDHYFVHLSFQEHFAARHLVKALSGPAPQEAIDFIKNQKYNQRFELVFSFASGLLIESDDAQCLDTFWNAILQEPLDLVGLRHMRIAISCFEESCLNENFKRRNELIDHIANWIKYTVQTNHDKISTYINDSLKRSNAVVNQPKVIDTLIHLLTTDDTKTKEKVLGLISQITISNPYPELIHQLVKSLEHQDSKVGAGACRALANIGKTTAIKDAIDPLVKAIENGDSGITRPACDALGEMGEKAASKDLIDALVKALGNEDSYIRWRACCALWRMGQKAATKEVIDVLLQALRNADSKVRTLACYALGAMGGNAPTEPVIDALKQALGNENSDVRTNASEALC
ncbi:unnamed protein product [Rotaria magnacalcarata]|uniref:NACHT domain-containing protein n=2 Tax=Rotaria magnacalcarata TaxID=392030 RepID=A0A816X9F3_9BILA|nr:unnamed protein product [Rotaria magnacalcarata]